MTHLRLLDDPADGPERWALFSDADIYALDAVLVLGITDRGPLTLQNARAIIELSDSIAKEFERRGLTMGPRSQG